MVDTPGTKGLPHLCHRQSAVHLQTIPTSDKRHSLTQTKWWKRSRPSKRRSRGSKRWYQQTLVLRLLPSFGNSVTLSQLPHNRREGHHQSHIAMIAVIRRNGHMSQLHDVSDLRQPQLLEAAVRCITVEVQGEDTTKTQDTAGTHPRMKASLRATRAGSIMTIGADMIEGVAGAAEAVAAGHEGAVEVEEVTAMISESRLNRIRTANLSAYEWFPSSYAVQEN